MRRVNSVVWSGKQELYFSFGSAETITGDSHGPLLVLAGQTVMLGLERAAWLQNTCKNEIL